MMKTVPVVEMKSHLSALLAEVEHGAEIAISRHGRVIARLVPEHPKMATEAFRPFWNGEPVDLEAPEDSLPEAIAAWD